MVTISLYFVHCAISCIRYAKLANELCITFKVK